jgi:hypothetical protein
MAPLDNRARGVGPLTFRWDETDMSQMRGLEWFDPLRYQRAGDRLPADDPAEHAISLQAQAARTLAGVRDAVAISRDYQQDYWDAARDFRAHTNPIDGAVGTAYLALSMAINSRVTSHRKAANGELRPFQQYDDVKLAGPAPGGKSFPSGHSSTAYVAAEVLSRLDPGSASSYYDTAREVARSRVYLGVHFAGDTAEGARQGVAVAGVMPYVIPGVFGAAGAGAFLGSRLLHGTPRTAVAGVGIGLGVLAATAAVSELHLGLFRPSDERDRLAPA